MASAVALVSLVAPHVAHVTRVAAVRLGAANSSTPPLITILLTFRVLIAALTAKLAPLVETLPSAIGMSVDAPGCSATLLLCVRMSDLDVFRNMFI